MTLDLDFKLQQTYEISNLVSLSNKYIVNEFQTALFGLVNNYKDYAPNNGECIITTTKSIEEINSEQVIDVEILLPVSYRIPVEEPYIFKKNIKITNALYTKVEDVIKIQEALNEVNQYIIDNTLQPITSAYLVQTKQDNKTFIEIYVGLNPNIL